MMNKKIKLNLKISFVLILVCFIMCGILTLSIPKRTALAEQKKLSWESESALLTKSTDVIVNDETKISMTILDIL